MKKKIIVLASLVCVIGLLGGLYAVGVAKSKADAGSGKEQDANIEELLGNNISTVSDIRSFALESQNGSISAKKSGDKWVVDGYKKAQFSQSALDDIANNLISIYSSSTIEENAADLEKYGLVDCAVVQAQDSKGNVQKLLIGSDTSDGMYTYAKLDTNNAVYMISSALAQKLKVGINDLIDKSVDTITSSAVSYIHIQRTGKDEMLIEYDPDNAVVKNYNKDSGLAALVMRKPIENMIVYPYNVETELLNNSAAIRPVDLVEAEPQDLSKYGLNEPYMSVELKDTKDSAISFKIGGVAPTKDGVNYRYAMFDDKPSVFTVNESALESLVSAGPADLIQPFIALHARSKVNNIKMKLDDKEYKVELKSEGDNTFVTDSDGTKRDKRNIYINGALVPDDKVSTVYEAIVGLQLEDLVANAKVSGEPAGYIEYDLRESDDDRLEFYDYDANFYRVKKGEDTSMLASKQEVQKLFADLAAYCS